MTGPEAVALDDQRFNQLMSVLCENADDLRAKAKAAADAFATADEKYRRYLREYLKTLRDATMYNATVIHAVCHARTANCNFDMALQLVCDAYPQWVEGFRRVHAVMMMKKQAEAAKNGKSANVQTR